MTVLRKKKVNFLLDFIVRKVKKLIVYIVV